MKNNIKALRTERKMTQMQLAAACGVNYRYIQKLESGEHDIGSVRLNTLLTFAKVFGVDINDLYEEDQ